VMDLLQNPSAAEEMASAGRVLVQKRYGWDLRAEAFEEFYQRSIRECTSRADFDWEFRRGGSNRVGKSSVEKNGKITAPADEGQVGGTTYLKS
jgi:hypothetical protein